MYAFQLGTVAALACATSVIGFRMKALVAYDPIFLRKVLMPFLKRRFRIVVSMLRGSSILWTTLWINA